MYEALMANGGRGVLLLASGNYAEYSLEPMLEMMNADRAVLGLGDGGAHSSVICDASATTTTAGLLDARSFAAASECQLPAGESGNSHRSPQALYGFDGRGEF